MFLVTSWLYVQMIVKIVFGKGQKRKIYYSRPKGKSQSMFLWNAVLYLKFGAKGNHERNPSW